MKLRVISTVAAGGLLVSGLAYVGLGAGTVVTSDAISDSDDMSVRQPDEVETMSPGLDGEYPDAAEVQPYPAPVDDPQNWPRIGVPAELLGGAGRATSATAQQGVASGRPARSEGAGIALRVGGSAPRTPMTRTSLPEAHARPRSDTASPTPRTPPQGDTPSRPPVQPSTPETTGPPRPTTPPQIAPASKPFSVKLMSFNILGSQHSAAEGWARGYAPGTTRARLAAPVIDGRDVVGLQELRPDQYSALRRQTQGRYGFFPGMRLGQQGVSQSVMWRKDRWRAVWAGTISTPVAVGRTQLQPVVRFQHRATGRHFYVINVRNAPGRSEAFRDAALRREANVVRSLRQRTGLPVFLMGDFAEKAEAFCVITSRTHLVSASGGSKSGRCRPPARMRNDWIFGPSRGVTLRAYVARRGSTVRRITNHAVLTVTARVR